MGALLIYPLADGIPRSEDPDKYFLHAHVIEGFLCDTPFNS